MCLSAIGACNREEPDAASAAVESVPAKAATAGNCEVSLEGPDTARAGEPTQATVSLKAKGDWKVNKQAPLEVEVSSAEAEVHRPNLTLDEASVVADKEVRMEVPFTPHTEGPASLDVHANFGVCDDLNCEICKERRQVEALVE